MRGRGRVTLLREVALLEDVRVAEGRVVVEAHLLRVRVSLTLTLTLTSSP